MIEDFLAKLGASTKITVGVAVTLGVGIEMIEVDRLTKTVDKYGFRPLEYNNSTREIVDIEQFREGLEELFEELEVPKKSNIILSLPNVYFGLTTVPILLTDDAITNVIISEVEQSYIFKRKEPVVAWDGLNAVNNTESRTVAYTALQKDMLEAIEEVCIDVGCKIVGLENSFNSMLRALDYVDVTIDQMNDGISWNLMVIMQNNYSILSMSGKHVVDYYEEPLALKSFVDDEIYNAIKSSAQLTLASLPASHLFIVSETDMVSAEVLSMSMQVDCAMSFLECNKYAQDDMLPISLNVIQKKGMHVSPEAIGCAIAPFSEYPMKLNLIQNQDMMGADDGECPKVNIGKLEVELTPDFIKKISIIIGGALVVPLLIILIFLNMIIIPNEQGRLDKLGGDISSLTKQIQKYESSTKNNTFDVKSAVNGIVIGNNYKISYLDALTISVPQNLWITYFYTCDLGKVYIKGSSSEVKNIYAFYKTLKQSVNNSDIRLYKLELNDGSIDNFVMDSQSYAGSYKFEITNMQESTIKALLNPETETKTSSENQNGEEQKNQVKDEKKSFFNFGKPIFGGNQNAEEPPVDQNQQSGAPEQDPNNQQSNGGLPPNLSKIEKF